MVKRNYMMTLILTLIFLAGCSISKIEKTKSGEPDAQKESTCEDAEGSIDYFVNGDVTACFYGAEEPGDASGMLCTMHNDLCGDGINVDDDVLFEQYCEDGKLKTEQFTCPNGCRDGACII